MNVSQKNFLSASILSANFTKLGDEIERVMKAGINSIHFDVMDHHFVPNLSFGPVVCQSLRKGGITAPIDVHLMVEKPEQYIEPFAKAGANFISFHPETTADVQATINMIKQSGLQCGLVFNPDKPVEIETDILPQLDMILLMSVFPGFGGQAFIESTLEKITHTRKLIDRSQHNILLAIDGGVKLDNIATIAKAGADFFILGSGLFNTHDYQHRVTQLRRAITESIT